MPAYWWDETDRCPRRAHEYDFISVRHSSGGFSYFSEINAKFAEKDDFLLSFVQKCFEMHNNTLKRNAPEYF